MKVKKLLFGLMVMVVMLPWVDAFADNTTYTYDIEEMGVQISIPAEYYVITRGMQENDPVFRDLGIARSDMIQLFEENDIYLNGVPSSLNEEIVVTMTPNSINSFSALSDTFLRAMAAEMADYYPMLGIRIDKYEIYRHPQVKFIKIYFYDNNGVFGLQYYTIHNNKAMNFTMRSYEGNLSSRQEDVIQAIVDSLVFRDVPIGGMTHNLTDPFVYSDVDSGVDFIVPAGWYQKEFVEDRTAIDAKFVYSEEGDVVIIYGSIDLWSQMTIFEQANISRAEINNTLFSKRDYAEMFGIEMDDVTVVEYNGVQYYKFEYEVMEEMYGIELQVTMTQLVYIDNGWMYTFQFTGLSTHQQYRDFEELLNSVQYP